MVFLFSIKVVVSSATSTCFYSTSCGSRHLFPGTVMNIWKSIISLNNSPIRIKFSAAVSRRTFGSSKSSNMGEFNMDKEREEFLKSLQGCIYSRLPQSKLYEVREASDRMKLVLEENLKGGKFYRGIATVLAYKCVESSKNITDEKLRIAQSLGWCIEMLQTYYIILDDITDNSKMRRGKPCWYLREHTGVDLAINDSIMLYGFMEETLKSSVGNLPNYPHFINIFNETLLYTTIGQHLDIVTGQKNKDYSLFTTNRYNAMVKYKTAFYTYKLPVTLGILLADQMNEETSKVVEDVSLSLGTLFQIQDDYIDCFGDESQTGKIGTDIQEGKCSWLAVKALERCSSNQLTVFNACYASKEPAHMERVKQLYIDLQIPKCYKDEEKAIYSDVVTKIQTVKSGNIRKIFQELLDLLMYNREN